MACGNLLDNEVVSGMSNITLMMIAGIVVQGLAETGIRNIPIFIEVMALRFAIQRVTKLTQHTTTKGFTLAIHPGLAVSPAIRITYFGIVA